MPFDGTNYDAKVTNRVVTDANPVTAFLESAWRRIDKPQKWCRGDYQSTDGRRHCSLGALQAEAMDSRAGNRAGYSATIVHRALAATCLYRAMAGSVIHFNDEHSHREVAAAWQHAIALSRL